MSRLQKKCFIVSTGLHLSLALVLLVGPAFIPREKKPETFQLLLIRPDILTDGPTKGGTANTQPPPPPPPAQDNVKTTPRAETEPPKLEVQKTEPPKETKNPDSLEVSKKPKIDTKLIVRNQSAQRPRPSASTTPNSSQKFRETISGLRNELSPSTPIDINPGRGDGGPVAGNYRDLVGSIYWSAWTLPTSTDRESAIVAATVTISRDGKVVSARITQPSGDPQVDASVRRTLDRVTFIAPFPEGASDRERTYPLNFDLKMKRLEG